MAISGSRHPYLAAIDGDWLIKAEPAVEPPPAAVIGRRYTRLTPADLDLGYAGRLRASRRASLQHRRLPESRTVERYRWLSA
jgi:ATP-dependent DNA helicase RecQ